MAALPGELRSRASRLVERFHLDAAGWFQQDEAVPHLATLAQAVWDGRAVALTYERGDRAVERVIGPLGLVLKGGVWYIVALTDGGQVRTFRGSRVSTARVLDDTVERPAGFDLANYWADSSSAYERESPTVEVVVRLPEDRTWRLADAVGESAVRTAERLDVADPDGWIHLRLRLTWPDEVAGRLLAAGSHVEVLEPAEIRARVIATAGRVVARYREATEGAGGTGRRDGVEVEPA
jgi:predicted DNA-binding transcriptional regulator YafY